MDEALYIFKPDWFLLAPGQVFDNRIRHRVTIPLDYPGMCHPQTAFVLVRLWGGAYIPGVLKRFLIEVGSTEMSTGGLAQLLWGRSLTPDPPGATDVLQNTGLDKSN